MHVDHLKLVNNENYAFSFKLICQFIDCLIHNFQNSKRMYKLYLSPQIPWECNIPKNSFI